ncbi:hypothetical protein [Nonomuraea endophytica]|uniref:hypothetical protein n=1 Tax=Nonomuraea endophytica TaxID=714136 RepID=UPI0037CA53F6
MPGSRTSPTNWPRSHRTSAPPSRRRSRCWPSSAETQGLDTGPSQVSLLFTSYFLVTAVAMLVTGWVSSRIGGKKTLMAGLALVVVFAALAGTSGTRLSAPIRAPAHGGLSITAFTALFYNFAFFTVLAFTLHMSAYSIGAVRRRRGLLRRRHGHPVRQAAPPARPAARVDTDHALEDAVVA